MGKTGKKQSKPVSAPSIPEKRYDLQILQSLRRIIRAIDIYSRKLKSSFRLTAPQLICLLCVVEEGPINTTSISKKVYLNPSTIVGILDRLETQKLVKRERDIADRRIVNVTATEEGIKIAASAPSPLQENLAHALQNLPEEEQSTIALSLRRIVGLMEAKQLDAAPFLETNEINHTLDDKDRK